MKKEFIHSRFAFGTSSTSEYDSKLNAKSYAYDPLTNLVGIREFQVLAQNTIEEIVKAGNIPVVVYLDLEGMKAFNTRYGFDEGDKLLLAFSEILTDIFKKNNCCRLGNDHFVVISDKNNIECELKKVFNHLERANSGKTLKVRAGIYAVDNSEKNIAYSADRAKMACDINKNAYESRFIWFNEKMNSDYLLKEYIVSHLDKAIERGWLRVYLQPVVRTLTNKLCNFEALARWEDPVYGLLQPNQFIPVIENNSLSFKFDMAIARRTARMLRSKLDAGKPIVPISLNFSRNDFLIGDPVAGIESILKEYDLPADVLIVEITESAIVKDLPLMHSMVERFHEIGIDVWMDDYGSGYSSLNVLKDFNFNEIKIDMEFLRTLNKRSQIIVSQTVQMAKKLGIHTLAEGVDKQEQLDFLRQIGCEKIQGYYFGKPMSFAEIENFIEKNQFELETREVADFYDKAGLVELSGDKATALFLYDKNKKFSLLYQNDNYKNSFMSEKIQDTDTLDINLNKEDSILVQKFKNLADRVVANGGKQRMAFVSQGHYFRFSFELAVQNRNTSLLLAQIDATNYDFEIKYNEVLDTTLRNIISIFDSIYLIDLKNDSRTVITTNLPTEKYGDTQHGLKEFYSNYQTRHIFPDDLKRWRDFMTREYIVKMTTKFHRGTIEDAFRIRKDDGNYEWNDFVVIVLPETDNQVMLACIKVSSIEYQPSVEAAVKRLIDFDNAGKVKGSLAKDGLLWRTLMDQTYIKIFWKDKNRRFVGASKSFLDYYNFDSIDRIKGKTDDEVGWHANNAPYRQDEMEVLKKGKIIRNSDGECVVNGVLKPIYATKFPVYKNGKIVGLMGYFIDPELEGNRTEEIGNSNFLDHVTGCMNARGVILAVIDMDTELRDYNYDYTLIFCDVPAVNTLKQEYGINYSTKVTQKVYEKIKQVFSPMTTVGRMQGCRFLICYRNSSNKTSILVNELADEIKSIRKVESHKCTLNAIFGIAKGSETTGAKKSIDLASQRLESSNNIVPTKTQYVPDCYSDLPLPFALVHPIIQDNKVIDITYLYVNSKYCEISGKTIDELVNHTYIENFPDADTQWLQFTLRACFGEETSGQVYASSVHHWLQFYCAPASTPGCCTILLTIVDEDKKNFDNLTKGRTTDDCIIKIARTLNSETDINIAMNNALDYLGKVINPDRIYVLDIDGWKVHNTTEWCKKGIEPAISHRENFDYSYISYWEKILLNETSVVVNDIKIVEEFNEKFYVYLKKMGIHNFITSPIYNEGNLVGYIGVENYRVDEIVDTRRLLETVSFFIADRKALSKSLKTLKRLSSHDSLTGAGSRNALFEKIEELEKVSSMAGLVFADLNGLKQINDTNGHAAGDEAIKGAANMLFRFCGSNNVYRNGGDEFIGLLPNITLGTFDKVRENINEALGNPESASVAVGFEWCEDTRDIESSMKKADKQMYEHKANYYKQHNRRRSTDSN